MDLGLKGKRAFVTGASGGIGEAVATELVREGAEVFINSRSEENLKAAAERIHAKTSSRPAIVPGDLTRVGDIEEFKAVLPPIDILVSNTGGPAPGKFVDLPDNVWAHGHSLLLESAIRLTRVVLDGMVERKWGRVIYITSIGVPQPTDDLMLSNVYRSGVTAMCKTLSNNHAGSGVTFNCVAPGYTATERLKELMTARAESSGKSNQEIIDGISALIPAGRLGRPEELAAMIAFLASEQAGYVTGTSITVDGGYVKSIL
jgi:3-oxoacyl-[acyl-carrier protein] reductase